MPFCVPNGQRAIHRGTDISHRGNPLKYQRVPRWQRSLRAIRDISGETSSRVPRPYQPGTPPRRQQGHSVQRQTILQGVCGKLLSRILLPEAMCLLSKTSGRILKCPARLPAPHHLLAVQIQRIVDNPLCRIDFPVIAEPQVTKPFSDSIQSSGLRLMP